MFTFSTLCFCLLVLCFLCCYIYIYMCTKLAKRVPQGMVPDRSNWTFGWVGHKSRLDLSSICRFNKFVVLAFCFSLPFVVFVAGHFVFWIFLWCSFDYLLVSFDIPWIFHWFSFDYLSMFLGLPLILILIFILITFDFRFRFWLRRFSRWLVGLWSVCSNQGAGPLTCESN